VGGNLVRHSHDPYLYRYPHIGLRFTYPPIAAGFFALIAGIKLAIMRWLITTASAVSLVATAWLTWGALGHRRSFGRFGATLAVAAVALWTEPVQRTLDFGQVDLILMFIVVADLCVQDRCWWKGTGVGLAAGFKLTPLIFIPYLLLTRRFRAAAVAAGTFALTIAGSLLLLPRAARHYWFGGLFLNPQLIGRIIRVGNQSMYGALIRLLGSPAAARPYWLAAAAVVGIGGVMVAAWASRRGQEMTGIVVCALTGLLVSPVSWSHHWVWVVPMLVVLADLAVRPASLPTAQRWRWPARLGPVVVILLVLAYPLQVKPGGPRIPAGLLHTVPWRFVRGYVMNGSQQLIGDLYVVAGLVAMGFTAGLLGLTRRRDRHRQPAALSEAEGVLQPGSAVRA
jgi:alpha-1,2-mannosyltransferase